MPTYDDQLIRIWDQYRAEVSTEPADLKELGAWARRNKLWAPRPVDIDASFARDMAEALRGKTRTDKAGRKYRAFIPAKSKGKDGLPLFKWADIDDAPRAHVEIGVQNERKMIAGDCYALTMKIDHYNAEHPDEAPLELPCAFPDDIAEMKIANGIDDAA